MPKRLTHSQLLGERGVALIAKICLDMGYAWHARNASLDAGIDGHIELRDVQTGEMANAVLLVQSKARSEFEKETADIVEFTCEKEDLEYWLKGNAPVLLILSRPATDDAYWVSIKDYFVDSERRRTRKVRFDKATQRFDASAARPLLELANASGAGLYFTPVRKREVLTTNLLSVYRFPRTVFCADTEFRKGAEVHAQLKEHVEWPDREWFLSDGMLFSVHDLHQEPWRRLCIAGSARPIAVEDWRDSDEPEKRRRWLRLLNECLTARLAPMGIRPFGDEGYFFKATRDLAPRTISYQSTKQRAERTVFRGYAAKADPSRVAYYRHTGFERQFRRYGGNWYLEINPTYHFTSDGRARHPYAEEYLSKIKTFEGDAAVGRTVIMFADLLRDQYGLFARPPYPYLGFGELAAVNVDRGIDERIWLRTDDTKAAVDGEGAGAEGGQDGGRSVEEDPGGTTFLFGSR